MSDISTQSAVPATVPVKLWTPGVIGGCLIGLAALLPYLALSFGVSFFIALIMNILGLPLPQ